MIGDEVTNYGRRTIKGAFILPVNHTGVWFEFPSQGRWEIQNIGLGKFDDWCAIRMTKSPVIVVTYAGDKLLPRTLDSADLCTTYVDIGMDDVKVFSKSPTYLQAITSGVGLTTELRLTPVTKR